MLNVFLIFLIHLILKGKVRLFWISGTETNEMAKYGPKCVLFAQITVMICARRMRYKL